MTISNIFSFVIGLLFMLHPDATIVETDAAFATSQNTKNRNDCFRFDLDHYHQRNLVLREVPYPNDALYGSNRMRLYSGKEGSDKKGYQFGDISRSLLSSFKGGVNQITGKESYEFGDLSRWLDAQAKDKVNEFTEKDKYQFGDITKEIIRRVRSGEYTVDDIILLCKVIVAIGVNFQPIASVLPVKLLMEMLDVSIAQDLSGKLVNMLSKEVDKRMKSALLGDENYEVGDLTKRAISQFTGKESYTFGDISSKIIDLQKDSVGDSNKSKNTGFGIKESSQSLLSELDKMDAITAESRELKADDLLHS